MVQSISLYLSFLLLTISPVPIQAFSYCVNYKLITPYYDSSTVSFTSPIGGIETMQTKIPGANTAQSDTVVKPLVKCASTNVASLSWYFYSPYASCESLLERGIGIWVNFASTKYMTTSIINIGSINGYPYTYSINSYTEGVLSFVYRGSSYSSYNNANDFDVTVPRNEWTFLVMYWAIDSSLNIYIPGQAPTIKSGISPTFAMPQSGGNIWFGIGVTASIYQILGFKSANMAADNMIITLRDGAGLPQAGTVACSYSCTDHICNPSRQCLASTMDCSDCDTIDCTSCATSGREAGIFCNMPICPNNCAKCTSTTACTQCNSGFYLYKNGGSTTCVDCATSCSTCNPSPTCYSCCDSIEENGTTCRVDKIGFQMSFSGVNLLIEFAAPLVSALTWRTITAQTSAGTPIPTTNWHLNTCAVGATSCTIVTDNVNESQLPIDVDFEFSKA